MLEQFNLFWTTFYARPDFWQIIAIPFVAGLIGWGTNWLAVQMTFYPAKFIGLWNPWLGWQGIIPRKAEKMTGIMIDNTLAKISTLEEFFRQMEPEKIAMHVVRVTDARLEELVDEVMSERNAVLWENLPTVLKRRAYSQARKQLPQMLDNLIDDMGQNIENLVDLKAMIVNQLRRDTSLLIRVFKECGAAEFKFVINSGGYFGFLFGIGQMFAWILYPQLWTLPLAGFAVGWITNWLALNLIFRPLNPVQLGPFRFQGLFLRRQNEVSETFCRIITSEILTVGHLMNEVFKGPKSQHSRAMIKRHLRPILEGGITRTVAQMAVGLEGYVELKRSIEEKAIEFSLRSFDDPVFNKQRGEMVQNLFCERMQAMTPAEFQDLLRPAFQEDEWILILIGGVLGAAAGFGQVLLM
ncbi:MAG TPA: hypothetical protein VFM46_12805 [Pseudomonadales bacterium]|nr:hypothetical protein [Pseudomonadales bacterium]